MLRSALRRARPPSRSLGRDQTSTLISRLSEYYSPEEWALLTEVRNEAGLPEVVRYADLWGCMELGTGAPVVVRYPVERKAESPEEHPGFLKSLLRSALARPDLEEEVHGAPLVPVSRPSLSHQNTGLLCGHSVPRPLAKSFPSRLPCCGCAGGFPTDREIVEAAIDDAGPEERQSFLERLAAHAPRGLASTRPLAQAEMRAAAGGGR